MTKQEILNLIDANASVILRAAPIEINDSNGIKTYSVKIEHITDDSELVLNSYTEILYVIDEQGVNEKAYVGSDQFVQIVPPALYTYLKAEFESYNITSIFEDRYIASVIEKAGNDYEQREVLVVAGNNKSYTHGTINKESI